MVLKCFLLPLGLVIGVTLAVTELEAAEAAPHATREYRVEFSADRLDVNSELGSLSLDGNVYVQAQRYRLKSRHLELQRGPRGVAADGSADLAFCTCDDPPLKLHVSRALLAPPTDALFGSTTLQVGGLPVFWLPGLWLRAPTRLGLTFPRLWYRGQDGFFVGSGGYVPLAVSDGRVTKSLTLGVGAYLAPGVRLEAELDTEASSSRVAWDHVHQSALEVDAHGSATGSDAVFAYRVDALRGARARFEPSALEVAARRTDRARVSVAHLAEFALGFGLRADAPRAGALRDFGAAGPELYLGSARAFGDSVAYDAFASARSTVLTGNHSQSALTERATLGATARPGPLGLSLTGAESASLQVGELRSDGLLRGGLQARLGLPLLRAFGQLSHFIEPVLVGRGIVSAEPRGSELNATGTLLAVGGVDTSLGDRATRQAASLSLRAGAMERSGADPSSAVFVALTRATADAHFIGASQSVALLGQSPATVSLSRLRVGARDGLHLLLRADGSSNGSPAQARALFDETWFDPPRPLLDRDGWSAGSELSVPWTRAFSSTGSLAYDLAEHRLLAAWGGLGYRHSCGCLAGSAFLGHRVGREGFDAWVGFDLAP